MCKKEEKEKSFKRKAPCCGRLSTICHCRRRVCVIHRRRLTEQSRVTGTGKVWTRDVHNRVHVELEKNELRKGWRSTGNGREGDEQRSVGQAQTGGTRSLKAGQVGTSMAP